MGHGEVARAIKGSGEGEDWSEEGVAQGGGAVLRFLLLLQSVLGGKLDAKLLTQGLEGGASSTRSWTGST
jgi:hypothetical protein